MSSIKDTISSSSKDSLETKSCYNKKESGMSKREQTIVPPHLSLLSLGLQQLDVKVVRPATRGTHSVHCSYVSILHQVFISLLELNGPTAHTPPD